MRKLISPCNCRFKGKRNGRRCEVHSKDFGGLNERVMVVDRAETMDSDSEVLTHCSNRRILAEIGDNPNQVRLGTL